MLRIEFNLVFLAEMSLILISFRHIAIVFHPIALPSLLTIKWSDISKVLIHLRHSSIVQYLLGDAEHRLRRKIVDLEVIKIVF